MPTIASKADDENGIEARCQFVVNAQHQNNIHPPTSSSTSVDLSESFFDEVVNKIWPTNSISYNDIEVLDLPNFFSSTDENFSAKMSNNLPRSVSNESSVVNKDPESLEYNTIDSISSSNGRNISKFNCCETEAYETTTNKEQEQNENDDNGIRKRRETTETYSEYYCGNEANQLKPVFAKDSSNKNLKVNSIEPENYSIMNYLRYTDLTLHPCARGQQENQINSNRSHIPTSPGHNSLDDTTKNEAFTTNDSTYKICYNFKKRTVELFPSANNTDAFILPLLTVPKNQRYQYPINILIDNILSIRTENSINPNGKKRTVEEIQKILELVVSNAEPSVLSKPDGPYQQCTLHILLKSKPWALDLVDITLLRNPECGIMVDAKQNTPLHIAIQYAYLYNEHASQCLEVIEHLFILNPNALAHVNMNGLTPSKMALYQSHCSELILTFLLEKTNERNKLHFHHNAVQSWM